MWPLCNQDPLGIAKAEPKQNLDNQAQTEFVDVASTQESERMVLRHATTSELGSGEGGEVGRGGRVQQHGATPSQEPRWQDAGYKFILPWHSCYGTEYISHAASLRYVYSKRLTR
jgi:hypothetical protein